MNKLPKESGLNLVPFIDIMLVLLCIVLSISTFIASSKIDINLPKAKESSQIKEQSYVRVSLDKDNNYFIDDNSYDKDTFVKNLMLIDKDTHISLHIDKESNFEHFVFLIDMLKQKHHDKFSIATDKN